MKIYIWVGVILVVFFFFFNDTATTEIYTLSLHDALPTCGPGPGTPRRCCAWPRATGPRTVEPCRSDRKSTRLNSSHVKISYAVFCLKKKKKKKKEKREEKKKKKKKNKKKQRKKE